MGEEGLIREFILFFSEIIILYNSWVVFFIGSLNIFCTAVEEKKQ